MAIPETLSRNQVCAVDQFAVDRLGIPSVVLMENAAINAAGAILQAMDVDDVEPCEAKATILCGGGNNGGDGYAIARHLMGWGVTVQLYAAKSIDQLDGDAKTNAEICQALDLPMVNVDTAEAIEGVASELAEVDVIIDALLGTGFEGEVRAPMDQLIQTANAVDKPLRVAIDTPSGLDCQSGESAVATFQADLTVTFVARKTGFDRDSARDVLGRVVIAEIGIPDAGIEHALQSLD